MAQTLTLSRTTSRRASMAILLLFGLVLAVLSSGSSARAETRDGEEFLVIVNPDNPTSEVSRDFAADAFLKKVTRWSNGETIRPVDLSPDSPTRRRFSSSVLKRSVAAVRSYWQQRIFAGRDVPPPELESDEAVVRYVVKYPGAVGYVASNAKIGSARVLLLRGK